MVLRAERDVQIGIRPDVHGQGEVGVDQPLELDLCAEVESRRRIRAVRGVDGVADSVDGLVAPGGDAEVVAQSIRAHAAPAGGQRGIADLAPEARREATGEPLVVDEAVRVGHDACQGAPVGQPVRHRHPFAGRRHRRQIRHQQAPAAVGEYAGASVGVAVEEAAVDIARRPVAEAVQFAHPGFDRGVSDQRELVLDVRGAPDHDRVRDIGVAVRDQARGLRILAPPAGGRTVLDFQGERGEASLAKARAEYAGGRDLVAVANESLAVLNVEAAGFRVVLEHEVHDARDGVGAVLGGGAVAEHLELLHRDAG